MSIVEDTRQQKGKHENIHQYFHEHGLFFVRRTMEEGDYAVLGDESVVIDTKSGMLEVYNNLIQDHARFRDECIRAKEKGKLLIILVEEPIRGLLDVKNWVNPRTVSKVNERKGKKPPVSSDRLMVMMMSMSERYGVVWAFCRPQDTGGFVYELLRCKERLKEIDRQRKYVTSLEEYTGRPGGVFTLQLLPGMELMEWLM